MASESAVATFVRLPELLRCLVDHIRRSKHLASLRLVSNNFHDAATPALFRAAAPLSASETGLNFKDGTLVGGLVELPRRHLAGYIRSLTLRGVDWHREVNTRTEGLDRDIGVLDLLLEANAGIQHLLVQTPLLESFTTSCPLLPVTIRTLHRACPRLKSLALDFEPMEETVLGLIHTEWIDDDAKVLQCRQLFTMPDLTVFANLEKLSLLNLYGDLRKWAVEVAKTLKNSPRLDTLELGLSLDAISRISTGGGYDDGQHWAWFESLCESYVGQGGSPLPIRTLLCRTAIFPRDGALLKRLVDLSHLEEVRIQNEDVWDTDFGVVMPTYDDPGEDSGIVFDSFANAPNLRRMRVTWYGNDVHRALCLMQDPLRARQIAIYAEEEEFNDLKVAYVLIAHKLYFGIERPIHPRVLQMRLGQDCNNEGIARQLQTPDLLLAPLVYRDEGALEGLELNVRDPTNKTGHRQWLTPDEKCELLERNLPRLANLSQLSIQGFPHDFDGYAGVRQRLAMAIPSLRYIRVPTKTHVETATNYHDAPRAKWDGNFFRVVRDKQGAVTALLELEGTMENSEVEMYSLMY